MSDTESSILGNIPDLEEGNAPESGGTNAPSQGDAQGSSNDGRSSAQPTQGGQPSSGTQQPIVRRHDGLVEQPNADNPRTRDLVDPVSGRIVAQGGIERRVFEEGQRHARENNALKQRVQGLENAVRSSNQVIQEAARLNIAPQDQMIAMRVMADFMRDPVRTLEGLVAEVKSKGYQIPFLQQGVSPGMDVDAIGRLIDNRLAPITQQRQQEEQLQQFRQQATRDLDAFTTENPESHANLDVLAEMLQHQPSLPLGTAYTKMIRWAHENGLDWTQPLKPQIAALRQQQATPQPQQPQPRPLPGRRSASSAGAQRANGAASGGQFNENASWADIIRSAMAEHGTQLN
jgi:cell division septum initiation protein DivIVA